MAHLTSLRARINQPKRNISTESRRKPPDWPGITREGPRGAYFLLEESYDGAFRHGGRPLHDLLRLTPDADGMPELASDVALNRLAFLDTETTGLAGGTGTIAFLIGIGRFEGECFRLRQYFLFDPAGEAQMLEDVLAEVKENSGLVTFNGRQFDVPILQARTVLRLKQLRALEGFPHLDLLPHARNLWRGRVESCALSSLETSVLGVQRAAEDVPGWAIPALYREYLAGGDPQALERVLYHNRLDILSMVTLAAELMARFNLRAEEVQDAADALAMARVLKNRGAAQRAEILFRAALSAESIREEAYAGLARLLKQSGRGAEAVPFWEAWAGWRPDAWEPRVELAKYFEWRARDYDMAIHWAQEAATAASEGRDEEKRMARVRRKAARARKANEE
jgi:uncharacterized protein